MRKHSSSKLKMPGGPVPPRGGPASLRPVLHGACAGALSALSLAPVCAQIVNTDRFPTQNLFGVMRYAGGSVFRNEGSINVLVNNAQGALISTSPDAAALANAGTLGTVRNRGLIDGGFAGVGNTGLIRNVNNQAGATLRGGSAGGIVNRGTIGTVSNEGVIAGVTGPGIANLAGGTLTLFDNRAGATLAAGSSGPAFVSDGQAGVLANSGLIDGTASGEAILIGASGKLDAIENSGVIRGGIRNLGASALTINGAGGALFGTLTGAPATGNGAGMGSIVSTQADLIFGTGNVLLQDNINAGSRTVTNAGSILQLTDAVSITGNYTQAAAATLQIVAVAARPDAKADAHGSLTVSGATTLTRGTSIALVDAGGFPFARGQRFVIMRTGGVADYNQAALNYSAAGYAGTILAKVQSDDSNAATKDLLLQLGSTDGNVTPVDNSTTDAGHAAAGALAHYPGTDSGLLNVANSVAALARPSDANQAGAGLSPGPVKQSAARAMTDAIYTATNVAMTHLDHVRDRVDEAGVAGIAGGDAASAPALWGQFFGGRMAQDQRGEYSGYHASYGGLVMGGDTQVGDGWRPGAMVHYTRIKVDDDDFNSGSSASVDSYGLAGYVGYNGNPWYVNATAGLARQRYSTTRLIRYPGFAGSADGSFNGMQYATSLQAGYPLAIAAGATLTPLAGMVYSNLRQDAYTESGGNGAALKVGESAAHSLKSDIGVKLDHVVDTAYGKLEPSAQLRWRREFHDARLTTLASFAADRTGATGFTSASMSPPKNTGLLVLGATLLRGRNLSISANYVLEAAGGYRSHSGDFRVRWDY